MTTTPSPELPDLDRLEALARAATPQNLDSAQDATKPTGYIECPQCGGDGTVELTADYCNYDGKAMGVQFYGIGPEHQAAEAFFRAANPAAVLALIALARRAQPEGEAPQAVAPKRLEGREIFEIAAPYFAWNAPSWHKATQGAVGMTGLLAFAEALLKAVSAAQHAEAPQSGNALAVAVERHYPHTETQRQLDQRAAFIKGYQAAQHAESGAQVAKNPHHDYLARYWQLGFDGQSMVACSGDKPLAAYNNGKKARAALAAQSQGAQPNEFEVAIHDCALILDLPKGAGAMDVCRAANRLATAAQQAAAPGALALLNADEMAALRRFNETCQDGEGYDVPKAMMQRLTAIGVVRRTSGSFYETTDFGLRVLEQAAPSAPGTPEAPSRDAILEEAAKAIEHDGDWCGGHGMPSVPSPSECAKKIRSLKRAAQLDGGQGEGERHA